MSAEPQGSDPSTEDEYRQLLDAAPDAIIVVGDDSRIEIVNVQAETLFGYARAELVGQQLEILIPPRFRKAHSGHTKRFFAAPTLRSMGSGLELFGIRKDGKEIPIEVSLSPVRRQGKQGVSAAIRDISERRAIQAALELYAKRLSSAVESIQDAFALFDVRDSLVLCNGVYARLIGEPSPAKLVGHSYVDILDRTIPLLAFETEAAAREFRVARLAERGEPNGAHDVRTTDGRCLRIANRRTAEGGVVQTIWDLTEDMQRAAELQEARQAAEAGSAAKSEFLSSMSHELRTPLNAILGFAQLLQRDKKEPLSARHKERVHQILKGGEHLLRLIDDILDLSRIEAGRVAISTEPLDAVDVLEEVVQTLQPTATRAGITMTVSAVPANTPLILADRTRLAQILMNFGSNAIKYNGRGGTVTFVVSLALPEHVRMTVIDTGMGVAEDKHDKLFQPFQRAGQETGPIEGTGIGLAITKRLVDLMRGRVGFKSSAGQGSEFWVELPTETDPASLARREVHRDKGGAAERSRRRGVVLYVEDNPANVSFMRDLLDAFEDIELLVAPTAEMGIELATARAPRVIIMDINLPGMNGLDALRRLMEIPETRGIPVIALTAAASERDRQRGVQAGFYRYLTKPVKVDELEESLEELLGP